VVIDRAPECTPIGHTDDGMLTAVAVALIGLAVALALAWLVLSGVLAMAFKRVRLIVRRIRDRRQEPRPEPDRRDPDHDRRAES
jgi:hypothetical protein